MLSKINKIHRFWGCGAHGGGHSRHEFGKNSGKNFQVLKNTQIYKLVSIDWFQIKEVH